MSNFFDFSEQYKGFTDEELLRLLDNRTSYRPEAIKAAEQELANRTLSPDHITSIESIIAEEKRKKEEQKEKMYEVQADIATKSGNLLAWFNPAEGSLSATEKIRRGILITSSLVFLYTLISSWEILKFMFGDAANIELAYFIVLIPIIIFPFAIICFWKKIPVGWMLLVFLYTFELVGALWISGWSLFGPSSAQEYVFFDSPPPSRYIFPIILNSCFLLALCREDIRALLKISRDRMWTLLIVSSLWTLVIMFLLNIR